MQVVALQRIGKGAVEELMQLTIMAHLINRIIMKIIGAMLREAEKASSHIIIHLNLSLSKAIIVFPQVIVKCSNQSLVSLYRVYQMQVRALI